MTMVAKLFKKHESFLWVPFPKWSKKLLSQKQKKSRFGLISIQAVSTHIYIFYFQPHILLCTFLHYWGKQLGKCRVHPDGKVLKIFRRVFLCVNSNSKNMLLVKSHNRLLCQYRGSISLTKPKFKLQPHQALQQEFFSESLFYKKIYLCILSLKYHLGNLCSHYGG